MKDLIKISFDGGQLTVSGRGNERLRYAPDAA